MALAVCLSACGGKVAGPALEVVVQARAELEADCIEVVAFNATGEPVDSTRFPREGKTVFRVGVVPGGALEATQVTVEATGFRGASCDEPSARSERRTVMFVPGVSRVTLTLEALPPPDFDAGVGSDAGSPDGGEDAGSELDAGSPDAGMVDAGADDAGSTNDAGVADAGADDAGSTNDAGVADAGVDAGVADAGSADAGADAGLDAGVDAGLDAGVDAGPFDDGGCGPPKDAGATCGATGVCTTSAQCVPAFPYVPSNFIPTALPNIAPPADLNCDTTIDSTNLTFTNNFCSQPRPVPVVLVQDGGIEVLALVSSGLTLRTGRTLTLIGTRPVVFVVFGDALLSGTVLAEAGDDQVDCLNSRGTNGLNGSTGSGAGGGGFGGFGGDGGVAPQRGGVGGAPHGNPELIPLSGGCPGGRGGNGSSGVAGGAGGAGGGAVQFSVSGQLYVNGRIGARGAGGRFGLNNGSGGAGGGGAGSGGAVLLEAQTLRVFGAALTANGGGGGQGGGTSNVGISGESGSLDSATPAQGGDQDPPNFPGFGGNGGAGVIAATNGMNQRQNGGGGGGGGASVGRIRLNGRGVCERDGGVISPPATGCP